MTLSEEITLRRVHRSTETEPERSYHSLAHSPRFDALCMGH